ncbi:DUF6207 family protein (plasmid) [Streptomyces clavifer]|nr:DUF6207 family protein [Streptomyces clavifer]WUC32457.1 DUF6207 family protein [Streptomyces clavifer]
MAESLQHPTPTLPPRTTITDRLRERLSPHTNYIGTSRITRVQDSGSRPITAPAEATARQAMADLEQHWATSGIGPVRRTPGTLGVTARVYANICCPVPPA